MTTTAVPDRPRKWVEYEGFMFCDLEPQQMHTFIPKMSVIRGVSYLACRSCDIPYDKGKHEPPVGYSP